MSWANYAKISSAETNIINEVTSVGAIDWSSKGFYTTYETTGFHQDTIQVDITGSGYLLHFTTSGNEYCTIQIDGGVIYSFTFSHALNLFPLRFNSSIKIATDLAEGTAWAVLD